MSSLCSVTHQDMSVSEQALILLDDHFGPASEAVLVGVPGRVNLIGEHIDYHNLPVLPMAIQRRLVIAFRSRPDLHVRAVSSGTYGERSFSLDAPLNPGPSGDWANYLKAASQAAQTRWKITHGIDAAVAS